MSDYIGFGFFLGFGLIWIIFPSVVVQLYTKLHSGKVKMPSMLGIRLAGCAWVIVIIAVWINYNPRANQ